MTCSDRDHDLAALRQALAPSAPLPDRDRRYLEAQLAGLEGVPGSALSEAARGKLHALLVEHVYTIGKAPEKSPAERFPLKDLRAARRPVG